MLDRYFVISLYSRLNRPAALNARKFSANFIKTDKAYSTTYWLNFEEETLTSAENKCNDAGGSLVLASDENGRDVILGAAQQ